MPDVFSQYFSSWLPSKTSRFLSIFWEPICSRDADERREQGFNTGVAHLISTFGMAPRRQRIHVYSVHYRAWEFQTDKWRKGLGL